MTRNQIIVLSVLFALVIAVFLHRIAGPGTLKAKLAAVKSEDDTTTAAHRQSRDEADAALRTLLALQRSREGTERWPSLKTLPDTVAATTLEEAASQSASAVEEAAVKTEDVAVNVRAQLARPAGEETIREIMGTQATTSERERELQQTIARQDQQIAAFSERLREYERKTANLEAASANQNSLQRELLDKQTRLAATEKRALRLEEQLKELAEAGSQRGRLALQLEDLEKRFTDLQKKAEDKEKALARTLDEARKELEAARQSGVELKKELQAAQREIGETGQRLSAVRSDVEKKGREVRECQTGMETQRKQLIERDKSVTECGAKLAAAEQLNLRAKDIQRELLDTRNQLLLAQEGALADAAQKGGRMDLSLLKRSTGDIPKEAVAAPVPKKEDTLDAADEPVAGVADDEAAFNELKRGMTSRKK